MRIDHDSLSADPVNIAPRIGFVFAPTSDNRTAIRGGFGVFFDKIPINVASLRPVSRRRPSPTMRPTARPSSAVLHVFTHVAAQTRSHVPYSLGWTLQFDRELRRNLIVRLGYEERHAFREFYVDPSQAVDDSAQLLLLNSGHQSYREFLAMMRWRVNERTTVFASYVHSQRLWRA